MKPTAEEQRKQLQQDFHNYLGESWSDSQGKINIYYVMWLENKLLAIRNSKSEPAEGAEEILKDNLNEHLWTFINTYPVAFKADMMLKDWIIEAMEAYAALAVEEATKDCYPKSFIEWFTGEKSPVSILYGNQAERFAAMYTDYTVDELFDYWRNIKK